MHKSKKHYLCWAWLWEVDGDAIELGFNMATGCEREAIIRVLHLTVGGSNLRLTDDRGRFDDAMGVLGAIQK